MKGFHLGKLAPSASAQQGYIGLQLRGRERLIIQPRHLAEDQGGTPSQSKVLRIEIQVSFYTGEKSGNFPESRGGEYWGKRQKKKDRTRCTGQVSVWETPGLVLPAAEPRMRKDKVGGPETHVSPEIRGGARPQRKPQARKGEFERSRELQSHIVLINRAVFCQ